MADAAIDLERSTDAPSYSPIPGTDRGTADRIPRPSSLPAEELDASQINLASLLRLGAMKLETGNDAEAEECFRKALEIGDRTVGPDNPDLILLLNDLTRIYLRQSAHAAAEPLLLRLLEMKRNKGEDHPEVATVLASLAAVRQALGRHESAEQLWRRVLEIRERTLAPNHFAIATALEHFGAACAARGKVREALAAFQRAHTIRERTLGSDHSSLRSSRERIADLQLQASDGSFESGSGPANPSAPERFRLLSGEPIGATAVATGPVARERIAPPTSRKATVVIQTPLPDTAEYIGTPASDAAPANGTIVLPDAASYRDVLDSIRDELESETPEHGTGLTQRARAMVAPVVARIGKREMLAAGVVVIIASLSIAAATGLRGFGETDQTTALGATLPTSESVSVPSSMSGAATANEAAVISAPATPLANLKPAVQHARVAEERTTPKKVTEQRSDITKVPIPKFSSRMMPRLDSVASKAADASTPFSIQTAPISLGIQRASFDLGDPSNGPQRARLIGELPSPLVPPEAVDVVGEVRVRFNVDTEGRPIMSTMSVIKTPNALLTTAVTKVIPGIRFEPARTGGQDSKVVGDVVEIGFKFARQGR